MRDCIREWPDMSHFVSFYHQPKYVRLGLQALSKVPMAWKLGGTNLAGEVVFLDDIDGVADFAESEVEGVCEGWWS